MGTNETRKDILLIGSQENVTQQRARRYETWVNYHTDKSLTLRERIFTLRNNLNRYLNGDEPTDIDIEFESISPEDFDSFPIPLNVKALKSILQYFMTPDYPGIGLDESEKRLAEKYGITAEPDYNI